MKGFFALLLWLAAPALYATEQAGTIFKQLAPSLYQIRLIDKASGEKSSIGSGFQITADGLIATNYHVISGFAQYPNKYQIQYLDHQGNKGDLTLASVDVINDLALVKRNIDQDMPFFTIADNSPTKGEELFSLGNPHDLGMIVVPGTYNGLKKESFIDKIHFTGSVNSGMSGGPVVNKDTQVVGINVATSGNQIGFLVPHDKLATLFNHYQDSPPASIEEQMAEQLSAYQKALIDKLLESKWQGKVLGKSLIPTIDVPFIRCWGESNSDKTDALILSAMANCALDEDTFIDHNFFTGTVEMQFQYMETDKISPLKFYQLYQRQVTRAAAGNKATKDDVTEFECHHDIVMPLNQSINNKSILCTRNYKKFPALFDVLYLGLSVDRERQALISHFTVSGVEKEMALAFTKRFMESVSWK
ncbi:trypsin-like peptidase domain-containing protein [Thalassotalea sp. M1531]|uniref:Trypsin-like peptidase domain-containing protein n=1 Tax=Thalassotalea algicola TaxID=2716224 RepID=A0A7Y0LAE1_9GAMM|nr:serine protease [Thalassotalea algicola]NMP30462.1 trypsin-like peptidase domain-containing protein [Thalassotalea algicola]